MRRNFCGKHNNLKLFDGSSPKKLFLNLWQVWMLIWDNFQTWPGLRLEGGGMAEEALLDPGVEMRWMESSCTVWSPGQRWWRRGGRWGGARGRDRWAAPAHNSWWGWARAESCAGRFKEVSIMIYQRKRKCVGKSFLIPMELALLVLLVLLQLVTLPRFECDKHASLASCHSKRKIQQQHIFACFGKSWLSTGAGGSAPCGNYSGRSCFATPSSSFSSPWSTGISPFVIFNFFIGIYIVYTGHIIVIFGTLMIW